MIVTIIRARTDETKARQTVHEVRSFEFALVKHGDNEPDSEAIEMITLHSYDHDHEHKALFEGDELYVTNEHGKTAGHWKIGRD